MGILQKDLDTIPKRCRKYREGPTRLPHTTLWESVFGRCRRPS